MPDTVPVTLEVTPEVAAALGDPRTRAAKDNKCLELALAAGPWAIVSGDADLLVLHPWRGVRILRPTAYLAETGGGA